MGFKRPGLTDPMIDVRGAMKAYGKTLALDGADITVKAGSMFGIIGPNGAGKSTLMKALIGSVKLDGGSIRVMGLNPAQDPLSIKANTGIVPESETPPSFLKMDEFLDFVMQMRGLPTDRALNERWIDFFEMGSNRGNIAKDLSKGTRQKLMLASAFVHEPPLFLLDEPFINLDPVFQKKIKELLKGYVKGGRTIVISTHILSLASEICDRIAVLNKGKVLWSGPTSKLREEMGDLETAFLKLIGYVQE
ncbi:MAG: ABC transporter ATP-binding protein [Candidatus Thermoplasmatota archaeon]|nr:ABC transporter ATP-binding protein [Candidatus Thermoplasmatota archaeon]